jgi:hypothetical protein
MIKSFYKTHYYLIEPSEGNSLGTNTDLKAIARMSNSWINDNFLISKFNWTVNVGMGFYHWFLPYGFYHIFTDLKIRS